MKKIKLLAALLLLLGASAYISCSSDDGATISNSEVAKFSAYINGQPFIAEEFVATIIEGEIVIAGRRGDEYEGFQIKIPSTATPGVFTGEDIRINYMESINGFGDFRNYDVSNSLYNGTLIIDYIDMTSMKISGSFNFTGYYFSWMDPPAVIPPIEVSQGTFVNIPITIFNPEPEPEPVVSNISASINGTPMTFNDIIGFNVIEGKEVIEGYNLENMHSIQIVLPVDFTTGSYILNSSTADAVIIYNDAEYDVTPVQGTLIINSTENNRLIGTFSYVGTTQEGTSYEVTGGQFNVQYQ